MGSRTRRWIAPLIYLVIAVLMFHRLLGAGFVTDFMGWLACQKEMPFHLIYQCFGVQGLYLVPYTLLYTLTSLFGLSSWAWFIVFTGGHVINAYLVSRVMQEAMRTFRVSGSAWMPFVAGLIFLVQPYQVEVIAWKACINYIACCFFMLSTIWLYMKYMQSGAMLSLIGSVAAYLLMLFTLEFALVLPFVLILLHISAHGMTNRRVEWKPAAVGFVLTLLIYVLLNLLIISKPVGHYEVDFTALHPFVLGSALSKYLIKVVFLTRFLSYSTQSWLYGLLDMRLIGACIAFAILLWYGYVWVSSKKIIPAVRFGTFTTGAVILLILPIAHLYFYYVQYSENDRYTYVAMPFIAMALVWLLWSLRFHVGKVLIAVYLCFCLYYNYFMVGLWEKNHDIYTHLVSSFRWDSGTVFILNLPDNYRGTFMFRNIGHETALAEVLQLTEDRGYGLQIVEVMQYNMATPTDGVSVVKIAEDTFRVEFNQWGTWWWRNGLGGTSYINERFEVVVSGQYYDVRFEDMRPGDKVVYFDGKRWREAT